MNILNFYNKNIENTSSNLFSFIQKHFYQIIIIFGLLFLFSCSDQSCIEANDFGEYKSQYVTVRPTIDTNCTFSLIELSDNAEEYYIPTASFRTMSDSIDVDRFFEIITVEYENLLSDSGVNNAKYESFFEMFDGDLKRILINNNPQNYITSGDYEIIRNIRNEVSYIGTHVNDGDIIVSTSGNCNNLTVEDVTINSCSPTNTITHRVKWKSKSINNSLSGCIMEKEVINGDVNTEPSGNFPPLDVFLECIEDIILRCNSAKSASIMENNSSSQNINKNRADWFTTREYDPEDFDTIEIIPESKIYMKSEGQISMSGSISYPDMFVSTNLLTAKLQNIKNNDLAFDRWGVYNQSIANLSIAGNWSQDGEDFTITNGHNRDNIKKSYNSLSRLVMYLDDELPISDINFIHNPSTNINSISATDLATAQYSSDEYYIGKMIFNSDGSFAIGVRDVNLETLIIEDKFRILINDQIIDKNYYYDDNSGSINDLKILLRPNDELIVNILNDNSDIADISMHNIVNTIDNPIFRFVASEDDGYISAKIIESGLYNINHSSCSNSNYYIVNDTDIYSDIYEYIEDGSPIYSSANRVYLRKGQRIYFDYVNSCDNPPTLSLLHKRPAFLCKKRANNFSIEKPLCLGGGNCGLNIHASCLNSASNNFCNLDNSPNNITEQYDDGSPDINVLMELSAICVPNYNSDICTSFIDSKCQFEYPNNIDDASEHPGFSICQNKCQSCMAQITEDASNSLQFTYNANEIDICYDLENYKSKISDLDIVAEDAINQSGSYKGARDLFFNGSYGNFVRTISRATNPEFGEFLLETSPIENQYTGSLNIFKRGKIKFIVINNEDFDFSEDDFENSNNDNNFIFDNQNGYLVTFGIIDKIYNNGQMMEIYLCHNKDRNNNADNEGCVKLNDFSNNVRNEVNNEKIIGISALNYNSTLSEYQNSCKESTGVLNGRQLSKFGYNFDDYGRLIEMNLEDNDWCGAAYQPSSASSSRKYYDVTQTNISDDKNYQLYFSIIDDQENNCLLYRDGRNASGNCNVNNKDILLEDDCDGVRINNPYYESDLSCSEGILINNPYFNYPIDLASSEGVEYCQHNCLQEDNIGDSSSRNECLFGSVSKDSINQNDEKICSISCLPPSQGTASSDNDADASNYCQNHDITFCQDKRYYCTSKLMDNSGSYDVTVQVKNESQFHGLIYSMVSPITDFIYGSPEFCYDGKEILDLEDNVIGTCYEIDHGKLSINFAGFTRDQRMKEYVILEPSNQLMVKYGNERGEIDCKGNIYPDIDGNCSSGNVNIISATAYGDGLVYENNVFENNERINHPTAGYIIRKDSIAKTTYNAIINNPIYQTLLKTLMVLSMMFYGLSYFVGMSEFKGAEIISKVMKIAVLLLFLSPTGWSWFQDIFVGLFEGGTNYLTLLMVSAFESNQVIDAAGSNANFDPALLFSSMDKMIMLLFSVKLHYKISALFFSNIFGWLYLLIIYYALLTYFKIALQVVLLYLSAKLFINFTFLLAPLLLLLLLFEQTKDTFNKWLKQMASFGMQQILIIFSFTLFNAILYAMLKSVLSYKICFGTVLSFDIIRKITLLKWWMIAGGDESGMSSYIPSLISILVLFFTAKLMAEIIDSMGEFAERMVDGIALRDVKNKMVSEMTKSYMALKKGLDSAVNYAAQATGKQDYIPKYGFRDRMMGRMFDAGKEAADSRKERLNSAKESDRIRAIMKKAGDKAVSNYKAKSLIGRGEENIDFREQGNALAKVKKLDEVRKKAMTESLQQYYKSKGEEVEKDVADKRRDNLLNPNYNVIFDKESKKREYFNRSLKSNYNADLDHDNLSSLAMSKAKQYFSKTADNKYNKDKDIKAANINKKDLKNAKKLLEKTKDQEFKSKLEQERLKKKKENIEKRESENLSKSKDYKEAISNNFADAYRKYMNNYLLDEELDKSAQEAKDAKGFSLNSDVKNYKKSLIKDEDQILEKLKDPELLKSQKQKLLKEDKKLAIELLKSEGKLSKKEEIDSLKELRNYYKDGKKNRLKRKEERKNLTAKMQDNPNLSRLEKRKYSKKYSKAVNEAINSFDMAKNTAVRPIIEYQNAKDKLKNAIRSAVNYVRPDLEYTEQDRDHIDKKLADIRARGGKKEFDNRVQEVMDLKDTTAMMSKDGNTKIEINDKEDAKKYVLNHIDDWRDSIDKN